jgi:16S rRNA (cytidine1402-2'-O)-methyltransferase
MRAKPAPINTTEATDAAPRGFSIDAHRLAAPKAAAGLYLVATPIGNLGDITLRALQTLAGVDVIACEDTRITRRLTERYDISAQLKQYHEHNAEAARPKILEALAQGGSVALVSDAGTPLISDPGYKLVREVCAAGHAVYALPGPSSVLAALSVAALPTDRFFFEGFLPAKSAARRSRLTELARIDATLVMFDSGNRVQDTLAELAEIMGTRDAARGDFARDAHRACARRSHAGDARRIRTGDRPACRGRRRADVGSAGRSLARAARHAQRQGCRRTCSRAFGAATP